MRVLCHFFRPGPSNEEESGLVQIPSWDIGQTVLSTWANLDLTSGILARPWGQDREKGHWDKVGPRLGTRLGQDLGQDLRPGWDHGQYSPWGSKFGLEKNFCSSVWKPILSDHAESEGSTAKNEGVGSLCVCWDIVPFLNSEKLGPGTWKAGQDLGQWTNWDQTSGFLARPGGPMLDKTGDRTLGQDLGQGLGQDLGQTMGQDLGQDKGQLGHGTKK